MQCGVVWVPDAGEQRYRLLCSAFWVDVRLLVNGRWIASADTPDGPSLGCGTDTFEALWQALGPFEGVVGELLASLPSRRRVNAPYSQTSGTHDADGC